MREEGGLVPAASAAREHGRAQRGPWAHHVRQRPGVVRHVHVPHGGRGVALTDEEGALDAGGDHLAHDLALDGGAQHGAQHFHRHAWGEAAGLSTGLRAPPVAPPPPPIRCPVPAGPSQHSAPAAPSKPEGKAPRVQGGRAAAGKLRQGGEACQGLATAPPLLRGRAAGKSQGLGAAVPCSRPSAASRTPLLRGELGGLGPALDDGGPPRPQGLRVR